MSESLHPNKTEHGTMQSYVIGFVLSLVFTAIPYYLVVNKTVTGNSLLATILTFALLQMFIQVFFFLHLGRGPKPLYNVAFFVSTVGIILAVVGGSIFIMNNLRYNMAPMQMSMNLTQSEGISQVGGVKTGACQEIYANHQITIKNGVVSPLHTKASLCDSLTFINEDSKQYDIAFGSQAQPKAYGGESEEIVHKGYPKTINLNQPGTILFHDKLEPNITGDFNVVQ